MNIEELTLQLSNLKLNFDLNNIQYVSLKIQKYTPDERRKSIKDRRPLKLTNNPFFKLLFKLSYPLTTVYRRYIKFDDLMDTILKYPDQITDLLEASRHMYIDINTFREIKYIKLYTELESQIYVGWEDVSLRGDMESLITRRRTALEYHKKRIKELEKSISISLKRLDKFDQITQQKGTEE